MRNTARLSESLAHGLVAAGLKPGEVIAIYLANSWEFCGIFHAASLCGAVSTLLNPSYREREVHHQLENSDAVFLVSDGVCIDGMNFTGLPKLRRIYTTRTGTAGSQMFSSLLRPVNSALTTSRDSSGNHDCGAPLFKRDDRVAEGGHVVPFEPGFECVSVHRTARLGVARR